MSDIKKKPYEISLWEDRLIWVKQLLEKADIKEKDYAPGKFYEARKNVYVSDETSENINETYTYILSIEPFDAKKTYYTLAPRDGENTYKENFDINKLSTDPVEDQNWYHFEPSEDVEGTGEYYYYDDTAGKYLPVTDGQAPDNNDLYEAYIKPATTLSYYKEVKLCVIGAHSMDTPIRAVRPKITLKVSGENELTFDLYSHYWDEQTGKLMPNPYLQYMSNERKVKLHYDGKWYDFIIKDISEDSSTKAFTYTCKDLFINELSKSGFELVFDNKLNNNSGNLQTLAASILKGSDWELDVENIPIVLQYLEEPVYEVVVEEGKSYNYKVMYDETGELQGATGTISEGKKFYVVYSSINKTEKDEIQIIYDPEGVYALDDKNMIVNRSEEHPTGALNCTITGLVTDLNNPIFVFAPDKRGNRLVRQQKAFFDPKLERTVLLYNDGDICGFKETDYLSPASVQSYVANPSSFTSTTGWVVGKANKEEEFPVLTLEIYPQVTPENIASYKGSSFLKFAPSAVGQSLMNSGLSNNRVHIGEFKAGELYTLRSEIFSNMVPTGTDEEGNPTYDIATNYEITIHEYTYKDGVHGRAEGYMECSSVTTTEDTEPEEGKTYYVYDGEKYNAVTDLTSFEEGVTYYEEYTELEKYIKVNSSYIIEEKFDPNVKHYVYTEKPDLFDYDEQTKKYKCAYSISEEEFKRARIGIFITLTDTNPIYIKSLEFYPHKTYEKDGNEITCEPGADLEAVIKEEWIYYEKDADYTDRTDLPVLPNDTYTPYYGDENSAEPYEKVRTITASESNRFNLLQELCELFERWIRFEIEHDDKGAIALDENYRQKKTVIYKQYVGTNNQVGFKYGINLKSIKRTLDSNGAISKIIVKDNSNEFAPGGFCSIARSTENPSGENTIYNFDYYVGQGLIDFSTLSNDLYFQPGAGGYIGYYKAIKVLNDEAQELAEIQSGLINDIANYDSQYQTYSLSVQAAETDKADQEIQFRELTNFTIQEVSTLTEDSERGQEWVKWDWKNNKEVKKIFSAIAQDSAIIEDHGKIAKTQGILKSNAEQRYESINARINDLTIAKQEVNKAFYKKYSRFIQEGSWVSEDYIDHNLYYMDAMSTLYTSSRPQVSYTIDVVEISQLDGYEDFKFSIGDKTFIEDKEFFGRAYDGSDRMYREEVIVSEVTMELDSPESNKLKIQNYKTQFEDLFQRVVATTQQVQFSTGEYKRSAAIVEPGGTINVSVLQNSFINNAITLQNAHDQSVIIGDDGITTTNLSRPSEILRLVAGGIYLSGDGGQTWTTGVSAGGINASCITTGSLNAGQVNITMGSEIAFRWDLLGISAYKRDENGINPGVFTRFDQFGLYGINGSSNFDALVEGNNDRTAALAAIKENASYGLTWDGFWLKSNHGDGYVSISSDKDFEVVRFNDNGGNKTDISVIQIGRLNSNDGNYYGIRINDLTDGAPVMESNQDGELWLRKHLNVSTSDGKEVIIGLNGEDDESDEHGKRIITANETFKVYEDGYLVGNGVKITNGYFEGGGVFNGTITATGGTIGGLTIEEWKEMSYSVRISSSVGEVIKNGNAILTAELYKGGAPVTLDSYGYLTEKDLNGEDLQFSLGYQWYTQDGAIGEGTGKTWEVKISDFNQTDSLTYTCVISLIPKEE